ncbi:MAG: type II toxin-antitoxin system prevent-host-death family antitoxin [Patescibacteria group bacterium]|mgnify:CR=1 FL=1
MEHLIGVKELRENLEKYLNRIKKGESFIVVKKSKPVFKIIPPESEEKWETVIDFTNINKNGISARKILKELRKLNA